MRSFAPIEGVREEPRALVVVATRGRPLETKRLLTELSWQDSLPLYVVVVGTTMDDLPGVDEKMPYEMSLVLSEKAGLTAQRNRGLDELRRSRLVGATPQFVVFFDDDFRPAASWLRLASEAFHRDPDLAGLTGQVLGDGINGDAIGEEEAAEIIAGEAPSRGHWSAGATSRAVESLYGCNMAVTSAVAAVCRFDEALPLYGWQEDCDFTGQVRRLGQARIIPECQGVHLGVKSARTSGLRLGYSQIANPMRIYHRKNMTRLRLVRFVSRALMANLIRTLGGRKTVDYRGRLNGNMLALVDFMRGRCSPGRILDLPG